MFMSLLYKNINRTEQTGQVEVSAWQAGTIYSLCGRPAMPSKIRPVLCSVSGRVQKNKVVRNAIYRIISVNRSIFEKESSYSVCDENLTSFVKVVFEISDCLPNMLRVLSIVCTA